ncbi:chitin-binding domain-containing protein [Roseovarius sp. 2305UL8-3]|uniref:chitin-binding domain-containing protein n=1 Tax=Roseovarius conchicola TaxID=3121636 RepID=UPI003527C263
MTRIFMIAALIATSSFATGTMACQMHNHEQAMSCAEGTTYDAETKTCVPQATG